MKSNSASEYDWTGPALLSGFVLISSARELYLSTLLKQDPLPILLASSFTLSTLIFSLACARTLPYVFAVAKSQWKDVLAINFISAAMWVAFLYALKWIEPAAAVALNASVGPIISAFFATSLLGTQRSSSTDRTSAYGVVVSAALVAGVIISRNSGTGGFAPLLGTICALISGVLTTFTSICAKRLANARLQAKQIIVLRFPLLIICSTVVALLSDDPYRINATTVWPLVLASIGGICIPLWIGQEGVVRSPIQASSLILAAGPIVTFDLQRLLTPIDTPPLMVVGIVGGTLSIFVGLGFGGREGKGTLRYERCHK